MNNALKQALEYELKRSKRAHERETVKMNNFAKGLSEDFGREGGPSWESNSALNDYFTTRERVRLFKVEVETFEYLTKLVNEET